jgi:glycolate oxidase iron-sulfur subunit
METRLADSIRDTAQGLTAEPILRACVHCGFCNATCPTYQLLGDELDGPRGRIYQIKQVLEGVPATRTVQRHLDRCLTCRNCETTCPSGVHYGHLVEIGRAVVERQVGRPLPERVLHALLRAVLTRRWLFGGLLRLARRVRWLLPRSLRAKLPTPRGSAMPARDSPSRAHSPAHSPAPAHLRQVLLLRGCTQPAMLPSIDAATVRVLDRLGIGCVIAPQAGCCGAIRHHLNDPNGALQDMRRNIDAWWPLIERGAIEAVVINASGCAVTVKEYGHLLRADSAYAAKARRVSECTRDIAQFLLPHVATLQPLMMSSPDDPRSAPLALQTPCTLQHGQQLAGTLEALLRQLGVTLPPLAEAHLCCGSAGSYSLLHPRLANALRDRKLQHLLEHRPQMILSDNIGCISHLATGTRVPVWHWIEWLDQRLSAR